MIGIKLGAFLGYNVITELIHLYLNVLARYTCVRVCVCARARVFFFTPEPTTKRRMSLARRGAAGALEALGADGGRGGGAGGALMAMGAAVLAAGGVHPIVPLAFIGIAIT